MFTLLKNAMDKQFDTMKDGMLFTVNSDKEVLWNTYLSSFPEGSNPIHIERTEHDCNCCKGYIRSMGNVVSLKNGVVTSIWDVNVGGSYQVVADAMSAYIKTCVVNGVFLKTQSTIGVLRSSVNSPNGILTWNHFYTKLSSKHTVSKNDIGKKLGDYNTTKEMFFRALTELTLDSLETVLELISQNSLYRGEEHKFVLTEFLKYKKEFNLLKTDSERDIYCWTRLELHESITRIRNNVIGSLLVDLSNGVDIENAVKSFEIKVAPTNYKRPTALVTKAMIEKAQKTVNELGLLTALERRYAVLSDISVNNILHANRDAREFMLDNAFDILASKVSDNVKNFDKVEAVSIEKFVNDILPKATSVEVMLENRHSSNLVSLVAPVHNDSGDLFKWDNKFSWSYTGDLTDSIKELVKKAGGSVTGDLRCSLKWHNFDDLDLHMIEPNGYEIYFANRSMSSPSGGRLDVDMNAGCGATRNAVENITYPNRHNMESGKPYKLVVENFCQRETIDVGFDVEIEFDGNISTISYAKTVKNKVKIVVAEIVYTEKEGFKITKSLPSTDSVKEIWGLSTQKFHKCSVIMNSPNHWDGNEVGNKHYFFMLEGCKNEGTARGFFNEYLKNELNDHRKVLEMVGCRMKTDESINQLSGIGFSSTLRNSVLCKVSGSFNRVIRVMF